MWPQRWLLIKFSGGIFHRGLFSRGFFAGNFFSGAHFFRKCDQIRQKLLVWPHLLKKYLMGNIIFCAVGFSDSKAVAKTNLQHKTKYLDVNPFMVIYFTRFICLWKQLWIHWWPLFMFHRCSMVCDVLKSSLHEVFMGTTGKRHGITWC